MSPNKRRVPLALIILLRVTGGILLQSGPIESLQQSLVCEGLPPSVILTDSIVDLTEDFLGFLVFEASKQQS